MGALFGVETEVRGLLTGSQRRRRRRRSGQSARVALPLALPMALGLALGVLLAVSNGTPLTRVNEISLHGQGDVRAATNASAAPAASSGSGASAKVNCDIIVPQDPLSARGLATPYELTGPVGESLAASGCTVAGSGSLGAFVLATILDPATGRLYVYEPLVVTAGTVPAVAPVVPRLPRDAVVDIMFGFGGTKLRQLGTQAFYRAAYRDIAAGKGVSVGQPFVLGGQRADTPANYCASMLNVQTAFLAHNQALLAAAPSAVPAEGSNLLTFLAAQLSASFGSLKCTRFGLHDPVTLTVNSGVAIAAKFNLTWQRPR